jgi:two-component system, cell cycle sensor histidine kinase and response regulator CckA
VVAAQRTGSQHGRWRAGVVMYAQFSVSLRDRELYRLFDRSPIGMYRCDEAGQLYYVNAALVRLLDYGSPGELLAQNLDRDIYAEPGERQHLIQRYRPGGSIDGVRTRWRTKHGETRIVQLYGYVTEDPEGAYLDVSVLDVTETEAAHAELRAQRETLETTAKMLDLVVRQMPAIYWLVDRELRLCRTGGAIREMLGYKPGGFVGMTIPEIHQKAPGTADSVVMHQRALAGETVTYATEFRNKHLVTTVCPHRVDGAIVGAIGTCIDVTAHHLLERHMLDAQRAESLGVLAGGLAHDFNNLLIAILGNTDVALREIAPGAPGRTALEHARQAGLRAAELTTQLLAYAGHGGVASTRVAPGPVLDELLAITAPTMPAHVSVRVDVARDLALCGDASQIRQVLLNLLNNARDALTPGSGTIAITGRLYHHDGSAHADDIIASPAGTYVALEVADDGAGMDRETRRRIFEPFYTTKPTGHGLGLAAVAGIIRAHGGGLRLATSPGGGARFQILWPSPPDGGAVPSPVTPIEVAAAVAPAGGHTVLVIDDEELVRDVVARMIEDLGYAAITATDGAAGLAIVEQRSIDAVLVDFTMPRMSGAEVVTALRARRPDLPIVLCSGFDRDGRGVRADAYLPKPFRIDSLDQTLAKLLPR